MYILELTSFNICFCIKSDVITLESIEMYGFVTVWTSMDIDPIGSFYSYMGLMI